MHKNNITKFIGLKDINIEKIDETKDKIILNASVKRKKSHKCSHCGSKHLHYHDSRTQDIKDIPYRNKHVLIRLQKIRYKCVSCGKKVDIHVSFTITRMQVTKRLIHWIYEEYEKAKTATDIAKECGVSVTSIFRYIDLITPKRLSLPEVFCIDEFKGDSGKEKYQVSLGDGENHKLIDILPSRKKEDLIEYFLKIPREERKKVKIYVSDMSKVFKEIHDMFFPESIPITDKYHYIRQVSWALENVRKREQNKMTNHDRIYFKRSKSLLHKQVNKLTDDEMNRVTLMLSKNEAINQAYYLKEGFYNYVLKQTNKEEATKALELWIKEVERIGDKAWISCKTAFKNWKESITNSFDYSWTNGYLEGVHNKIKTLKRITFTMKNFHHFRTKIIFNFL